MGLRVGQDADLFQVQLVIVTPLVFPCWCGLRADHDLSFAQLLLIDLHNLLEILNVRVASVQVALYL